MFLINMESVDMIILEDTENAGWMLKEIGDFDLFSLTTIRALDTKRR